MGTASPKEALDQRVKLQVTKVKKAFAAKYPADDEVQQNAEHREERIP